MAVHTLVTGGAGFIGSHVTDELIAMGHEVVVLDDLSGGYHDNVSAKAQFVEGNCTDIATVEKLFESHTFDYVFHLAAYAAEGLSHFIRRFNYTNNIIGSMNVINACVNYNVKCLVFTSSIAVYGRGQVPMVESMTPEPEDPYGISKYAVELDLAAARQLFGLRYIIFRPHNVYGQRQNTGDQYRNVIGIFMNQMLHGQPCTIFGDGQQQRAFTYIGDIASAIARSVEKDAAYDQVFNIGAYTACSVNDLLKAVQKAMGLDTGVRHLEARNEVVNVFADHHKARDILNYSPATSLEDGLSRMADWVRKVGPRQASVFGDIEIEKNLPSAWRDALQK